MLVFSKGTEKCLNYGYAIFVSNKDGSVEVMLIIERFGPGEAAKSVFDQFWAAIKAHL